MPAVTTNDSIGTLVAIARTKFDADANLPISGVALHSQRLDRDLDSNERVGDSIQFRDVLDVRSTDAGGPTQPSVETRTVHHNRHASSRSKMSTRQASMRASIPVPVDEVAHVPAGLPGCRLGVFVISPIKAENLLAASRFRPLRASLACQLRPYTDVLATPTASGPYYTWSAPMRFTHTNPTASGILAAIDVFDDAPLGNRAVVGRAYVSLEESLDTPGMSVVRWIRVERTANDEHDEAQNGRLLVSVCFHPKVTKGPTVHQYLHSLAHAEVDPAATPRDTVVSTKRSWLASVFGGTQKRRREILSIQAAAIQKQQALRRNKGTLSFRMHGIHLCSTQCSRIDGHASVSLPEFAPIAVVRFDNVEKEIRVNPTECDTVLFDHEWPVYSSFSKVDVEIYRRSALGTGSDARRLKSDGSYAIKVGGLSLSCFDIQERVAASWTATPPTVTRGPGKNFPARGFQWYPLTMDGEEIGLVQIAAAYTEDLLAILDTEESTDLSFVPPDERTFEAAIVQRNFERLDDLYTLVKEINGYWDDTLDWKSPTRSLIAWGSINFCFFRVPEGHFPLIIMIFLLGILSATFVSYIRGQTSKKWIEHSPTTSRLKMFRPMATLRVAPLRASHLRSIDGPEDHPDSFVRMFYEPNFKKIPVHQFAQTECARRSRNPEWTRPQRDSVSREVFLRANNSRFKEMVRHLSQHAQNAVLHDVVESWIKKDGSADANAFRFSILQPVQVDATSEESVLVDWQRSPSVIRFDVVQDGSSTEPSALIGRVRVPIRSLVTHEIAGGEQEEFELTLPLATPPRHATISGRMSEHQDRDKSASLTVRIQLTLRNPTDRVTLRETLASEALYEATELEVERELSWVEKYHKAKDVAKNIQQALGSVCSTLERFKNLFLWVHPHKTLLVVGLALLGSLSFYLVPMKYFVLYATTKAFTRRFHKIIDMDAVRFQNLLITIPNDLDRKRMYHWKNQEFLRAKEHTETQAKLQALWSGNVLCQRFSWLQTWNERYCAVRGGQLELWHSIADAKAGLPARHSIPIASSVDTCTKTEAAEIPKDCFPLVVVDISRSLLTLSPCGSRKIICLQSEDDLRGFTDAVRTTGEFHPVSSLESSNASP